MSRPKKDGRYLNLYLDRALHGYYETESRADNERKIGGNRHDKN